MSFFLSGIPIPDTQDIGDSLPYINKAFFDLDTTMALLCAGGRNFATLTSMVSTTNGDSSYFLTNYINGISDNYLVYLDGVKQIPTTDYTVNPAASTIVFETPVPPSGLTLEVTRAVAVVSYTDDKFKLPLTGGTLTGGIKGTSATFSSSVSAPALSGNFYSKNVSIRDGLVQTLSANIRDSLAIEDMGKLRLRYGNLYLDGSTINNPYGTIVTETFTANNGTFLESLSAPALSGTFFGDGSKLTGILTNATTSVATEVIISTTGQSIFELSTTTYTPSTNNIAVFWDGIKLLAGRDYSETDGNTITLAQPADAGSYFLFEVGKLITRSDGLSGTTATFASISSTYYYGDGSKLTGISTAAVTSIISPEVIISTAGQTVFNLSTITYAPSTNNIAVYWDGIKLLSGRDYSETDDNTVTISQPAGAGSYFLFEVGKLITRSDSLSGTTATFASVSSTFFYGDGSRLTGISSGGTANALPLSGGTLTGPLTGGRATFTTSISAPALSGTFFGDGSRLTGISAGTSNALALSGGTLTGALSGTTATFSTSISAPALSGTFYGDGRNLHNLDAGDIVFGTLSAARLPAIATFSTSVSAPALSGTHFGDGSNLSNLDASKIVSGTLNTARLPAIATFNTSVSAPALSGAFFGDGSELVNVKDSNKLPLSGGNITGSLNVNDNFGLGTTTPATKMHVVGNSRLQGNVTIFGDLSCTGTQSFSNTVFATTSALSVINTGPGAALYVGNSGLGDIASFYDIDQGVEVLHVGGNNGTFPNVGVKTSSPNKTLTVNGEISATQDITTSGNLIGARATFNTSVSAPALSGAHFGDGSNLSNLDASKIVSGTLNTARLPAIATFNTSVSAPALSGAFFGDGSRLTNIGATDSTKLPITGGILTGSVHISSSIFTESLSAIAQGVSSLSIDVSRASFFTLNLTTSITTLNFINVPASSRVCSFTLQLIADGTARSVAWPASVRWPEAVAPIITSASGRIDTISFLTYNGGATWFGYSVAQNQ